MFDLTVLPYFVFTLMVIPPFILGYFKGWRSGLFTLILTIVSGGILIGISIGIYESALWPLFKNLFIENHNPGNLDVESLKEISKTSVISIAVGIGLIPFIFIMWGLYVAFKKLLNKYMQPKIKKISKNEVSVYRKNLILTKAGGVLINGTAGLIIASAAAGAVSTLTIPSNKSRFFTSMTNAFGDVMTFGQGQYNEDYQRMFEFVKKGKYYQNQIDKFREVFGQPQADGGTFGITQKLFNSFINPTNATTIKEHEKFITDTHLMAKDSEQISKALVLMLLKASKTNNDFHLVGFDSNNNLSKVKKESEDGIKLDDKRITDSEKTIGDSLKELSTFIKNNSFGIQWNADGVKAGVEEYFNSKFVSYEDSPYRFRLTHSGNALIDAKNRLQKMEDRLASDKSNISKYEGTQKANVAQIIASGKTIKLEWEEIISFMSSIGLDSKTGHDYPTLPSKPNINKAPWNDQWASYDESTNIEAKHTFYTSIPNIQNVSSLGEGSYAIKEKARVKNEDDLKITGLAKQAEAVAKANVSRANGELNNIVNSLNGVIRNISNERRELSNKENFIAEYNDHLYTEAELKYTQAESNDNKMKSILDTATTQLNTAIAEFDSARTAQRAAEGDARNAKRDYDSEVASTSVLKAKMDDANKELLAVRNSENRLNINLKNLEDVLSGKTNKDPSYVATPSENDKISVAKAKLADASAITATAEGKYNTAKNAYDKNKVAVKKQLLDDAERRLNLKNDELKRKQDAKDIAQGKFNTADRNHRQSTNELNSARWEKNELDNKYNDYNNRVSELKTLIPRHENDKTNLESQKTNKEAEIKNLESVYSDKQKDFVAKTKISDASTRDYNNKMNVFEAQVEKMKVASRSITEAIGKANTIWVKEQALEKQITDAISDKLILEDPTVTTKNPKDAIKSGTKLIKPIHDIDHWSILDQEWTVSDIDNAKAQYKDIDEQKSKLYILRKNELIQDITKALVS